LFSLEASGCAIAGIAAGIADNILAINKVSMC
jgi:hypothetical protein